MLTVFENEVTANEIAYLKQQFAQVSNLLEDEYFIVGVDKEEKTH